MKKNKWLIAVLLVVFVCSGCMGANNTKSTESENNHDQLINDPNISLTDTLIHDEDQYIVYFTQNGCPNCEKTNPIVMEFAKNNPNYKVYVYDIGPSFNQSSFNTSQNETLTLPQPVSDDVKIKYTPTVFVIQNQMITNQGVGFSDAPTSANTVIQSL